MRRLSTAVVLLLLVLVPASASGQEAYTTLGQQSWGNENASFNGVPIPALIDDLIPGGDPLRFGIPGRSVSFFDGSEGAIIAGLSASHQPAALPEDIGDVVVDATGALPPGFPANNHGKFKNLLLGETVALALNVRLDPELAELGICPIMKTVGARPGPDGLYGTADDTLCAPCDTMTVHLSQEVLDAFGAGGAGRTVGDILALSNRILAGQGEWFDVTPHQMNEAVKVINRAFKRCRFLVECTGIDSIVIIDTAPPAPPSAPGGGAPLSRGAGDGSWLRTSSPAFDVATVSFGLPEESNVRIALYSITGRELSVVFSGRVTGGVGSVDVPVGSDHGLASGVYLLRMTATGLESGATFARSGKVLVLR
jgi:hypothetical protein